MMNAPTAAAAALLLLLASAAVIPAAAVGGRQLLQSEPLLGVKNEPGKVSLQVNTDAIGNVLNNAVTAFNDAVRGAGSALQNVQLPRLPTLNGTGTEGFARPNSTGADDKENIVLGSSLGGLGGLGGLFNPLGFDQSADNQNCISDPRQFIEAFLQPSNTRRNLCVSDNLIFRLTGGPGFGDFAGADGNLTVTLNRFFDSLSIRPISFWTFKDGGEKYLRIGRPRVLGSNVDGFPADPPNRNHYKNESFPGIRDVSNGLSFLEQVGFESAFVDITKPYMLWVGERPTRSVPSFVPTWSNVVTFFSDYIGRVAGASNFTISQRVAAVLDNTTFADLTGCPAQCTWQDRLFPQSPLNTSGRLENGTAISPARTAIHAGTREAPGNCSAPRGVNTNDVDLDSTDSTKRFQLTAPTSVAEDDPLCSDAWKLYFEEKFGQNCTSTTRFTAAGIRDTALRFYSEFIALPANDYELQALVLRAYLATSCSGDFNPLFSGNGFTYTGSDGIVSPTVHELLTGAVQRDQVGRQRVLGNYAYAFFCLTGGEECCLGGCGGVFPAAI